MKLSTKKVNSKEELIQLLLELNIDLNDDFIAVDGIVLDEKYNWILMRRGPGCRDEQNKLEGIGGRVKANEKFDAALKREIKEEVGENVDIKVLDLFEIRTDTTFDIRTQKNITWIIISFICFYKSGALKIMEPTKNLGFEKFSIHDIDVNELSSSSKTAYDSLKNSWNEIKLLIDNEKGD